MAKKAFLVQTTFLSRVVVEVNESGEVVNWNDLVSQVKDSIITKTFLTFYPELVQF